VRSYRFLQFDVFTGTLFGGNQLAVFTDARGLTPDTMQAIAKEMNFSETTFLLPPEGPGTDVRMRIFTPAEELPMAGHPTIGTAVVLETLGLVTERTVFDLGVGPTPVRVRAGWAEMDQRPPRFGAQHADPAALAAALSIDPVEVTGAGLPAQAVSTGVPYLILPVRTLEAMRRMRPRLDLLEAALADFPDHAVYAFSRESELPGSGGHCRMFAPHLGVTEDPATGSAAGPLACYLAVHTAPGDGPLGFRFEQGFEMGRPSLLETTVERAGSAIIAVRVAGDARIVAEGSIEIH
jgi:trans-2,3-dihydro-3-hydroxyanthranilate isomerase